MKTSSPRQIALFIALVAAALSAITLTIDTILIEHQVILLTPIMVVITFAVVYFVVYYVLQSFIIDKINPIYKTIHNINIPERELRKDLERKKDVITDVKVEVIAWAKDKTKEIAELKKLEKYRKEFLGNVSHELKTPIFNIQGYVLTLLDGGLDDPNINKKYLERTEKSINRMISIVEDLESISLLESGEILMETQKFNIIKLFDEVFELQEMIAKERNIKLKFDKNYEKALKVIADRNRILEVANNLIVNSVKYGRDNGETFVSFMDMGENLLIEVTDNGIGIAEQDIKRIFERFYRTDKSRSRDMGGTGLGLSIVKHIIEAHNQTINVRSTMGKGSSFAFTLKKA
jgi:two-component system phosphate regulon sensor histidine kinase PhoR